ncbi:MAG: prepilin-type N-terminal cleavage/methylation domain-containing protein [Desulfobacteraceae bacterium]|nr:prepilin-type N-terminal cleavage/methylation domain-containing protein [Desulfobacteraceae bacterium]
MSKQLKVNKKGFTLIEIMVVIGILGILAGIAIPNFLSYRAKSFCSAAEQDASKIVAAVADYFSIATHQTMINENDIRFAITRSNTAAINGTIDAIIITVVDGSGQCPDVYMSRMSNWNSATSTYTKTIP